MWTTRTRRALLALSAAAGLVTAIAGAAGASAAPGTTTTEGTMTHDQAPKGARATVRVSPNPTAHRGEELTITGNCGGGTGLKSVLGGFPDRPVLENIRILETGPDHFVAKATLAAHVGNGVGPVFVDCGGEAGVTLLVTHV